MLKKSSSLSAALINRSKYVFPAFTFNLNVSEINNANNLIPFYLNKIVVTKVLKGFQ